MLNVVDEGVTLAIDPRLIVGCGFTVTLTAEPALVQPVVLFRTVKVPA